jgi:hypothetical protein
MSTNAARINISPERKHIILDICSVYAELHQLKDPHIGQLIAFNYAQALEMSGQFVQALTLLSELITTEASMEVDLSYIIFRAAGNHFITFPWDVISFGTD